MIVRELVDALLWKSVHGDEDRTVEALTADSRAVVHNAVFIALRGEQVDGHTFVMDAIDKGASAVIVEERIPGLDTTQVVVPDTRVAAAILANVFYRHPSRELKVIGVTGTKGKTTTAFLIDHLLCAAGLSTGLMGTIHRRIGDVVTDAANTTPESLDLQQSLRAMRDAGATHAVMEVSSEGLEKKRVRGTKFRQGIFTNFTQDHLNFHGTIEAYRAAKGKFFAWLGNEYADRLCDQSIAVINADDPNSDFFVGVTACQVVTYGIENARADFNAVDLKIAMSGTDFTLRCPDGETPVRLPLQLTGRFNVYNALAAAASAWLEGISLTKIAESFPTFPGVPGRLERVSGGQPFAVIVDYSHTPDSLEKVLATIHGFVQGRVITVVGCGGDRDATKRPMMARIAVDQSDLTVLTSDNPRTEDPDKILDEMEMGVQETDPSKYVRLTDRKEAIIFAIRQAREGDVVLIAGKGHETYQIIGHTKYHFDDREVALEAIRTL